MLASMQSTVVFSTLWTQLNIIVSPTETVVVESSSSVWQSSVQQFNITQSPEASPIHKSGIGLHVPPTPHNRANSRTCRPINGRIYCNLNNFLMLVLLKLSLSTFPPDTCCLFSSTGLLIGFWLALLITSAILLSFTAAVVGVLLIARHWSRSR